MMNEAGQIRLINEAFAKHYPYKKIDTPFAEILANGEDDIF